MEIIDGASTHGGRNRGISSIYRTPSVIATRIIIIISSRTLSILNIQSYLRRSTVWHRMARRHRRHDKSTRPD